MRPFLLLVCVGGDSAYLHHIEHLIASNCDRIHRITNRMYGFRVAQIIENCEVQAKDFGFLYASLPVISTNLQLSQSLLFYYLDVCIDFNFVSVAGLVTLSVTLNT
jgi:hypothetical protein